jgi:hypothetical protein
MKHCEKKTMHNRNKKQERHKSMQSPELSGGAAHRKTQAFNAGHQISQILWGILQFAFELGARIPLFIRTIRCGVSLGSPKCFMKPILLEWLGIFWRFEELPFLGDAIH